MHDAQDIKDTVFLRWVVVCCVLAACLLAIGWVAHPRQQGPNSVTTVGVSKPGAGAGIYNGLRAHSVRAVTEISRLEQRMSTGQDFSLPETDLFQ